MIQKPERSAVTRRVAKETVTGSSNKTYFNSLLSSGLTEDEVSSQLEADRRPKFVVA